MSAILLKGTVEALWELEDEGSAPARKAFEHLIMARQCLNIMIFTQSYGCSASKVNQLVKYIFSPALLGSCPTNEKFGMVTFTSKERAPLL